MDKITLNDEYQLLFKFKPKGPENNMDLSLWLIDGYPSQFCPSYLEKLYRSLKEYCNIQDLRIVYDEKKREFGVYTKKTKTNNEMLVEKCMEFNFYNGTEAIFIPYYPSIPYSPSKNMVEKNKITYFSFSVITRYFKKTADPFLEDIKGKNDIPNLTHLFGAYIIIEPTTYCIDTNLIVNGQISVRDIFFKKGPSQITYSEINDIGEITSEIKEENDEVTVVTKINLNRALEINPQGIVCTAEPFYELLTKDGDYLTCTDHFVIIASGTRLLHYCDEYHCFEVFDLPDEWNFNMGITEEIYASRKIFTDSIFDEQDPDIKEIYTILDSRKLKKHYSS